MNKFIAKSDPVETIQQHTNNLMINYNLLRSLYPDVRYLNWEILELACLYHDLGKMNTKFQNKIMKSLGYKPLKDNLQEKDEIYHNFLSPAFLPRKKLEEKYSKDELKVLYQSIYRHHHRHLPHFEDVIATIKEDLEYQIGGFNVIGYDLLNNIDVSEGLSFKYIRSVKDYILPSEDGLELFYKYVITKGLLNKIDYAASSYIDGNILEIEKENIDLTEKVNNFFYQKGFEKNSLQEYMEDNKEENNIIIASTGIGKTEAALLWIGNNKGFFTLPLRVSINAIYDRIKGKDIEFYHTGLLHSDTYSEYLKRIGNERFDDYYYSQTKQMSLPLTICTLDQLIDFIFRYDGFEIKLATLSYSKLIIDEIQAYSPEFVGYLICALKFITDVGGKFSIVTATFPPIIEHFMEENQIPYKKGPEFFKEQSRHHVEVIEENINLERIRKDYHNKKVLVICNTVKKAQELYGAIKEEIKDTNIRLLHSRFIKRDRGSLEVDIIQMGQRDNKETGIWITTQIVEASLDIDFDELHTELSELTGLFQRMGRTYRNRELKEHQEANIYVYTGTEHEMPSGIGKTERTLVDIDIFNYSRAEILKQGNKIYTEKLKMEMVTTVYAVGPLKESKYYEKIKDTVDYIMNIEAYFFEKGEQKLRDIKNETIIPIKVYQDNKGFIMDKIDNIQKLKGKDNKAAREVEKEELSEFFVDIPYYMLEGKFSEDLQIDKYNLVKVLHIEYCYDVGIINTQVESGNPKQEDNKFF